MLRMANYYKIIFQLAFILLFAACSIEGQSKYEFSGYGAAGYRIYDRNKLRDYNQEVYYEGKFQADIKISKDIETQLDFRGYSEDNRVILKEFSIKSEHIELIKLKVGHIKRPFGAEQLINNEDLLTIDESYMLRTIEDIGYGGRSISLMAYYKYKEKRAEFPYSYYLSFFKDNSLNSGFVSRFSYHANNFRYSVNYLFQHKSGEERINTYGLGTDIVYDNKNTYSSIEINLVQDPVESIIRRITGNRNKDFAGGINLTNAVSFKTGEVVKAIEPVLLLGAYSPDINNLKAHTLEAVPGVNIYFDKNMRIRLNGDILFKKDKYNSLYSTIGSRFIIEFQAKF
jgi:hypothetical protein